MSNVDIKERTQIIILYTYILFYLITIYFIGYHYNEINDNEYSHIDMQYLKSIGVLLIKTNLSVVFLLF